MPQFFSFNRPKVAMLLLVTLMPCTVFAQSTEITTEYLMTLHAPLDAPQLIDESTAIFGLGDGGWVKGPRIEGTLKGPGGDWLQVLPDGTMRLDVRLTIETNDGALIYVTYEGVTRDTEQSLSKRKTGELVTPDEKYFIIAPTLRTSSEKYGWLNHFQCIGKMTRTKSGDDSFVEYDIFIVR